jgi:hypothetical protein
VQHQELPQHDRGTQVLPTARTRPRSWATTLPHPLTLSNVFVHAHRFEYLWKDEGRYKQATALPAPQYISLLFQATEQIFTHGTVALSAPVHALSLCQQTVRRRTHVRSLMCVP